MPALERGVVVVIVMGYSDCSIAGSVRRDKAQLGDAWQINMLLPVVVSKMKLQMVSETKHSKRTEDEAQSQQ